MSYKDLLVHLDETPRSAVRLELAVRLAASSGAHLTGMHAVNIPASSMFYGYSMTVASPGPEDLIQSVRAEALQRIAPVEAAFRERLRQEGLEGEWRVVEGDPGTMMALHARYADLAIVGQPNSQDKRSDGSDGIPATMLLSSGRPALVVPFAGRFETVGEHVLVAWNATREAARALNDALPLLRTARLVTVLAINPDRWMDASPNVSSGDLASADISLHLARHGVKAEAAHTVAKDISAGEALLSYASDIGADLIVAGAYGHSRMRELAFGGVTRTLLNEMTVPVLFSH